jgi:hypothetical protein
MYPVSIFTVSMSVTSFLAQPLRASQLVNIIVKEIYIGSEYVKCRLYPRFSLEAKRPMKAGTGIY